MLSSTQFRSSPSLTFLMDSLIYTRFNESREYSFHPFRCHSKYFTGCWIQINFFYLCTRTNSSLVTHTRGKNCNKFLFCLTFRIILSENMCDSHQQSPFASNIRYISYPPHAATPAKSFFIPKQSLRVAGENFFHPPVDIFFSMINWNSFSMTSHPLFFSFNGMTWWSFSLGR